MLTDLCKKLLCTELLKVMGGRENSGSLSGCFRKQSRTVQGCSLMLSLVPTLYSGKWGRVVEVWTFWLTSSCFSKQSIRWTPLLIVSSLLHLVDVILRFLTHGWPLFLVSEPFLDFHLFVCLCVYLTGNWVGTDQGIWGWCHLYSEVSLWPFARFTDLTTAWILMKCLWI